MLDHLQFQIRLRSIGRCLLTRIALIDKGNLHTLAGDFLHGLG